jgi:serine/threonine-protein kinase HipA
MPLILDVFLNDTAVGQITQLPNERSIFTFAESYAEDESRPVLSQAFIGIDGQLAHEPQPTNVRLQPFFSNLLPEGKLRDYIATKAEVHPDRELHLLALAGSDLPGAVIVRPQGEPTRPEDFNPEKIDGGAPIKFSLAGVQLKFSAIKAARGGLTIPATGRGGAWIVKLPSETFDAVPENEMAMMTLAKAVGLDVPEFDLVPLTGITGLPAGVRTDRRAYIVKRFDRDGQRRIHIEDFAQVFGLYPGDKYGKISYRNIAHVIWRETGETGLREFIKRFVFNAAIGNGDMHAKNWSLIYRDGRTPELSPGYDFLTTLPYVSGLETLALGMVGTKIFANLDEARFIRLAEKADLPPEIVRSAAIEAAHQTLAAWHDLRDHLDMPRSIVEAIDRHMPTVPLLQAASRPRARKTK